MIIKKKGRGRGWWGRGVQDREGWGGERRCGGDVGNWGRGERKKEVMMHECF